MMDRQKRVQKKLFYTKFSLDQRVPKDHVLRKIAKHIDFDFIYKEVQDKYGSNGNVSEMSKIAQQRLQPVVEQGNLSLVKLQIW